MDNEKNADLHIAKWRVLKIIFFAFQYSVFDMIME